MKDDYSDVVFSQGLLCKNTNNNSYCVVIDGNRGSENDRASLVLEFSQSLGFFLHTPPNRALKLTGKICDLKAIAKAMAQNVVTE